MKLYGVKSTALFVGLFVTMITIFESLGQSLKVHIMNGLLALGISVAFGVFSYKVIKVDNDRCTIIAILNPFLKRISVELKDISLVKVRTNSLVGLTTITIVSNNGEENSSVMTLLNRERLKFIDFCNSANIKVETFAI